MDDLAQAAIDASLSGDFNKAIIINKKILAKDKKNVEALNRLGCAYLELGELKKAKQVYKKALAIDSYNFIILKNLKKISHLKNKLNNKPKSFPLNIKDLFLTEPGKTKVVSLINLPATDNLLHLTPGTPVVLVKKRRSIAVYLQEGEKRKGIYLGALPDDLSFRLLKLIRAGNHYHAYIKTVSKNSLTVLIKETFRGKKFQNQPSFPEPPVETPFNNPRQ